MRAKGLVMEGLVVTAGLHMNAVVGDEGDHSWPVELATVILEGLVMPGCPADRVWWEQRCPVRCLIVRDIEQSLVVK